MQLAGSFPDRLVDVVVRGHHGDRLPACRPRFDEASLVAAGVWAVVLRQVHLDACDAILQVPDRFIDVLAHMRCKSLRA
jgi:hypothetical protein